MPRFQPILRRAQVNFIHDARIVGRLWLPIASVSIILAGIVIWNSADSEDEAANIATYVAGFASALAFLWLAAGFRLQTAELSLQRQELQLQRIATQQQAKELSNSAKLSSLGQIQTLLREAENEVSKSALAVKTLTQLPVEFMKGIQDWNPIEDSKSPEVVISAYEKWLPREAVARNYIRHIAAAMKLYIEHHHPNHPIDANKTEEEFVFVYQSWVTKAPFLSHHIGIAATLAQFMVIMKPGMDRMRLAVMVAHTKAVGADLVNYEALSKMRDEVLKHSSTLPGICHPWPAD